MMVDEAVQPKDLHWDPWDWSLHADSHPTWRRMREEAPLYRNDEYDFWALTRFQDVLDVLVDTKTYTSTEGPIIEAILAKRSGSSGSSAFQQSIIFEDPPLHTVHRQLLSRVFTPRAVKRIEDRVREFAQRVLDGLVGSGGFDFVDDYGGRVPGMVIATMLGTPDSDLDEIRRLTDAQIHMAEDEAVDDRPTNRRIGQQLDEYFMEHALARRKDPSDDIMSALVTMEFTDTEGVVRKLDDVEAVGYITLLSSAGNETVARLTGWAGAVLAAHPEQRAKLVARPELIPNAVEEILRYEPPAMALSRVATRDVVWHDQVVPEGGAIMVVQASTGRDQRVFPNPDVFDVERRIDRHLSFGFGAHLCLGASLARLEARIVIEEMLARFPTWDVDLDRAEIVHTGSAVRGYSRLPITLP